MLGCAHAQSRTGVIPVIRDILLELWMTITKKRSIHNLFQHK